MTYLPISLEEVELFKKARELLIADLEVNKFDLKGIIKETLFAKSIFADPADKDTPVVVVNAVIEEAKRKKRTNLTVYYEIKNSRLTGKIKLIAK